MSTGTLLLAGTDLASLCIVEDLSDFWSSSDLRGDLPTAPGADGAVAISRPISSKVASGQVTVADVSVAAIEDGVAAVKALLRENVSQTLTRRKVTGAGNLDATQTGIVRNVAERWIGGNACTLLFSAELVDGLWYGSSVSMPTVAGTSTVLGDTGTHKILVTLAAGPARTVASSTNGYYFQFHTTVPTGGVLVDVEARTATAITGGADMSANLSWPKVYPFRLEAGSNTLALDAGSASLTYQPAYL